MGWRLFVPDVERKKTMRRTLLAVGIAVLVSLLFVPSEEWGFWGWGWRQPFWEVTPQEWRSFWPNMIAQTVFLAALFAVIVNLRKTWRRHPKRFRAVADAPSHDDNEIAMPNLYMNGELA